MTMALAPAPAPAWLRTSAGRILTLPVERWNGDADTVERRVLALLRPPIIDIGCGPGRHTEALARRGLIVLGIDAAPAAVVAARERGAPVLERSVFAPMPGEGRWLTALLLDGNVGIGGDPVALLDRVRQILAPGGETIVEVEGTGAPTAVETVRIERDGAAGPWFRWARVGVDGVTAVATAAGLRPAGVAQEGGRWFARLCRD